MKQNTDQKSLDRVAQPYIVIAKNLIIYRGHGSEQFVVHIPELSIPSGNIVAIVGQSGCGKSSLLTVLGLMRGSQQDQDCRIVCEELSFQFEGKRHIVYKDLKKDGSGYFKERTQLERLRQKAIGFCLQGGELIPSLSLRENVAVTVFLGDQEKPLIMAESYLEKLKLKDQMERLPDKLSGGQRQRGIVARALAHSPALVILDEPTSSLDRPTAEETLELLKECTGRGQTVLMVTHDRILAGKFADMIVVMDNIEKHKGGITEIIQGKITETINEQNSTDQILKKQTPCDTEPMEKLSNSSDLLEGHETWGYYLRLGFMDALGPLCQLRSFLNYGKLKDKFAFTVQVIKNSVVLVAIGLLILILMGMRSGLIEQFRENLTKSPTGRQLILTPKMRKHGLTLKQVDGLREQYPELELTIPVTKDVVSLEQKITDESSLTVYGTVPKDPMLSMVYSDSDFSSLNADAIVLSRPLAEKRGLSVGDQVTIWVRRFLDAGGEKTESMSASLALTHIINTDELKVGYVHIDFARQIADYKGGRPVPNRKWPGLLRPITPQYSAFLLATKRLLSPNEERVLKGRGLVAQLIDWKDPVRNLYGWLKSPGTDQEENKPDMHLWRVQSGRQDGDYRWLNPDIGEVESRLTDSDGIMLPWSQPLSGKLNGKPVKLIGLSGRLRWLKKYLSPDRHFFSSREKGWIAMFDNIQSEGEQQVLQVTLRGSTLELPVTVHIGQKNDADDKKETEPEPAILSSSSPILAVPASFLAHLYMVAEGFAEPDYQQHIFRSVKDEEEYYQIRAYVRDVYQVTRLHKKLSEEFGIQSNAPRVAEMKKYAATLDMIVYVISVFALLIAFFTAFLVFREVGESKKRMIATLCIMGLTPCGVYVLMIVRSILVAGVAAGFLAALGWAATVILEIFYEKGLCLLNLKDYFQVIAGIVIACVIGVLFTSRSLVKTDPVVAFEEANKFA